MGMSIDELLLSVNDVGMDTLVSQTEIRTKKDVERLRGRGYVVELTEQKFRKLYPGVDPACVYYTPSISSSALYFNRETMAVCSLPFVGLLNGCEIMSAERVSRHIADCENKAAKKRFMLMLLALPDRMRFSYFELLFEKYGADIPELYGLFFSIYRNSDYGFNGVSRKVIDTVLSAKTAQEKAETAERVKELPEIVTVYRGGNSASAKPSEAYSWTTDINVANFFASRRGKDDGYIVKAEVDKKDIIEYHPDESEREVIAAPENVRVIDEACVYGLGYLQDTLPLVGERYRAYKAKLDALQFAQASDVHGKAHELRVLLLCLMIAESLDLPDADVDVLATAAIYHDTQRVNDDVDTDHGKASRAYYEKCVKKPNLLVSILCEYHCRPDEEGYSIIRSTFKNKEKQQRYIRLFNIFKDADGLERVRFGLRDLDLNYLRTPIAKQLSLVARLCLQHVEA